MMLDETLGVLIARRATLDAAATGAIHKSLVTILNAFERREALRHLAGLIGGESPWATACRLERSLSDFEARGYRRIASGGRPPRDELELLMLRVLRAAPAPCARSIWRALRRD